MSMSPKDEWLLFCTKFAAALKSLREENAALRASLSVLAIDAWEELYENPEDLLCEYIALVEAGLAGRDNHPQSGEPVLRLTAMGADLILRAAGVDIPSYVLIPEEPRDESSGERLQSGLLASTGRDEFGHDTSSPSTTSASESDRSGAGTTRDGEGL